MGDCGRIQINRAGTIMNSYIPYKTWTEVHLDALRHNYRTIRAQVHASAPDCRMIAVVKANAYGHGADLIARTLAEEGCDFFAVSCVYEAILLRETIGRGADIIILGYSLPSDAETLVRHDVIQTVFAAEYAQQMSREMARLKALGILPPHAALRTHCKVDTGMNRLGFDGADAAHAAEEIIAAQHLPHLKNEGMFTHFACADEDAGDRGMTARQLARFESVERILRERGECPAFLHCCNSAAALHLPEAYKNGVRAGVILYGMSPDGSILPDYQPVLTLKTRIAHVHVLRKGESVSYGATFTAPRDMRIATLPIGYADGFVRSFSGASVKLADGTLAPIVGRICMDQCMIDVGDHVVHPGDPVTIFGGDDGRMIEQLARVGGTINYEITCILTPRVPRIAIEGNL